MTRISLVPLRTQLAILLAAVLLPVFVSATWLLYEQRQAARDAAQAGLQNLTTHIAGELQIFLNDTEAVMRRFSSRPKVQAMDTRQCDPAFFDFIELHPEFTNMVLRDASGHRVCSTFSGEVAFDSFMAFPWFRAMLGSDKFLVSGGFIGPASDRNVVMLTHPVINRSGKVSGFLMLPVDLRRLGDRILVDTPPDALITVADRANTILMRSAQADTFVGNSLPAIEVGVINAGNSGELFGADAAGLFRRFAVETLPSSGWRVIVGARDDAVMAASNKDLLYALTAAVVFTMAWSLMVWRIGLRIVRPIDRLANVSVQIASGDVGARVPMSQNGSPEIETVAREFNRMLDVRGLVEAALSEREQRLSHLLSRTSAAIFTSEASGEFGMTFVSDSVQNLLGYSAEEFVKSPNFWRDHMHPADRTRFAEQKATLLDKDSLVIEYRLLHKEGQYRWLRDELRLFRNSKGVPQEVIGFLVDVTESKRAQDALRHSEDRFRAFTQLGADWYWEQDDQFRFVMIDGNLPAIPDGAATGLGKTRWGDSFSGLSDAQWQRHRATLEAHETFHDFQLQRRSLDGSTIWVSISGAPFFDDQGHFCGYRGIGRDITAQKAATEQIHTLAYYDALTGLPNRRFVTEQLKKALSLHQRNQRLGALLFIDLDNFKALNDTLGHDAGDMLLQHVSQRLKACVRDADTVARLGGDEFVVMLADLGGDRKSAASGAEAVGRKILGTLGQLYLLSGREFRSTPSVGITLFGQSGHSLDEVFQQADMAMYQAKAAGRNTMRFFDASMQEHAARQAAMEADLGMAIRNTGLELHYQPVVSADGKVLGAEALVRWQHPIHGLVGPAEFIPLAETTGLILPLGKWVLEAACAQLVAWATSKDTARLSISVNVSVRQFKDPDFVNQVLEILHVTGANPHNLKLELTESLLAENVEEVISEMQALRPQGIHFALDDFGTGYSSLSYLKRLPLSQIKIDRSFVRDVLTDPNDAAIARTIVALGGTLGLSVIAEGVETEGQREFLVACGCQIFQGYLFGRPQPIAEFDAFLLNSLEARAHQRNTSDLARGQSG